MGLEGMGKGSWWTGPNSLWGNLTGQADPNKVQSLMGGQGVMKGLKEMGQVGRDFLDPYSTRNLQQFQLGQRGAMDLGAMQGMQMGQNAARMGMGGGIGNQQASGAYASLLDKAMSNWQTSMGQNFSTGLQAMGGELSGRQDIATAGATQFSQNKANQGQMVQSLIGLVANKPWA
jgi:hypothetical protein